MGARSMAQRMIAWQSAMSFIASTPSVTTGPPEVTAS